MLCELILVANVWLNPCAIEVLYVHRNVCMVQLSGDKTRVETHCDEVIKTINESKNNVNTK